MFQLSFGMMEFWINGLLDLFIIPILFAALMRSIALLSKFQHYSLPHGHNHNPARETFCSLHSQNGSNIPFYQDKNNLVPEY